MMTLSGLTDMDPLQDIVVASPFGQAMIQSLLTLRVLGREPRTEQISMNLTQTHQRQADPPFRSLWLVLQPVTYALRTAKRVSTPYHLL